MERRGGSGVGGERSGNVFYDLAWEDVQCHFHNVLLVTQQTLFDMDAHYTGHGYEELRITGAILEAGYHTPVIIVQ